MHVTATIDCTPEEARVLLGQPDLQPLHAAIAARMERRMLVELDRFSPDRLMKTWLSVFGQDPRSPAPRPRHGPGRDAKPPS
ncbi:hypothetical protein OPKNFCMD_1026 [Methylobacterium crusticola]|uniref:Uncharacterized protein n=1 Tax=Methylobacterium crusticola TaxID=1697972 RepID=A0ABQ4QTM9_9HYPH|nr:DUF6489 family protein [Methylobacterium crusticola]GJD48309.1 hypothetical protein OPKNFCMD_1026 [Methylobacterium crusticola]